MKLKNTLRKNTRFSEEKILQILECFCSDFRADFTAKYLKINRKTINDWYMYIRYAIYWHQEEEKKQLFSGTVEVDESYFWPRRVRGKRWRWAGNKIKVFWILERWWKVYTEIVPNCEANTLLPIIRWKVTLEDTIVNSDGWTSYNALVDIWAMKHYRVHHSKNEFARGKQHINGMESFWSYAKRRMAKSNGIRKEYFLLHLKESEFRYNCMRTWTEMKKILIKILRKFTNQLP